MRKITRLLALVPMLASLAVAGESNWPRKAIEVINPSAVGGETDLYGRLFNRYLEKEIGKPVVTINMAGGGGTISTNEVSNAAPDGYRMLTFHNGFLINKLMGLSDLDVDSFEIACIEVIDSTQCFFVPASAPYNNAAEMVNFVRDGGEVKVATEIGSFTHFQLLALERASELTFDIVDAGTTPEKIMAMLGGNIDVMGAAWSVMRDYVANQDFKCIGLLSDQRHPQLADIPTFKEQGFDIQFDKFFFLAFPKDTPAEIVRRFSDAAARVGKNPEFIKECEGYFATASGMTSGEAAAYMKKVYNDYAALASAQKK